MTEGAPTAPAPAPTTPAPVTPVGTETLGIMVAAMPEAMARLAAIARGKNKHTALRALGMLSSYLNDAAAVAASEALGAEAASEHLAALAWIEQRQAELTGALARTTERHSRRTSPAPVAAHTGQRAGADQHTT